MSKQLPPELRPQPFVPNRAHALDRAKSLMQQLGHPGCNDAFWLLRLTSHDGGCEIIGPASMHEAQIMVLSAIMALQRGASQMQRAGLADACTAAYRLLGGSADGYTEGGATPVRRA